MKQKAIYNIPLCEVVEEVPADILCTSGDSTLTPGQGEDWGTV